MDNDPTYEPIIGGHKSFSWEKEFRERGLHASANEVAAQGDMYFEGPQGWPAPGSGSPRRDRVSASPSRGRDRTPGSPPPGCSALANQSGAGSPRNAGPTPTSAYYGSPALPSYGASPVHAQPQPTYSVVSQSHAMPSQAPAYAPSHGYGGPAPTYSSPYRGDGIAAPSQAYHATSQPPSYATVSAAPFDPLRSTSVSPPRMATVPTSYAAPPTYGSPGGYGSPSRHTSAAPPYGSPSHHTSAAPPYGSPSHHTSAAPPYGSPSAVPSAGYGGAAPGGYSSPRQAAPPSAYGSPSHGGGGSYRPVADGNDPSYEPIVGGHKSNSWEKELRERGLHASANAVAGDGDAFFEGPQGHPAPGSGSPRRNRVSQSPQRHLPPDSPLLRA